MALQYNLVSYEDKQNITVVLDGEMLVADNAHPNWEAIYKAVVVDKDSTGLADKFEVGRALTRNFQKVSERVSIAGGSVLFDGDPIHNSLTEHILRFLSEGVEDWKPLVAFMEKVQTNPEQHSREQLYEFLSRNEFTITDDGDILGYKSVRLDGDDETGKVYRSMSSGKAFVNGVQHTGTIPQSVGDVVEMPRSEVAFDPSQGCSTGLHVANYQYASTWSTHDAILLVKVNPRDVVSVPSDASWSKVRVCRYEIVETTDKVIDSPVYVARHAAPLVSDLVGDEVDSWEEAEDDWLSDDEYDSWDSDDSWN